jgi:hypothetical protein
VAGVVPSSPTTSPKVTNSPIQQLNESVSAAISRVRVGTPDATIDPRQNESQEAGECPMMMPCTSADTRSRTNTSGRGRAGALKADDLVKYCEEIASASGGILGIGRISAEERALLSSIAAHLSARRS